MQRYWIFRTFQHALARQGKAEGKRVSTGRAQQGRAQVGERGAGHETRGLKPGSPHPWSSSKSEIKSRCVAWFWLERRGQGKRDSSGRRVPSSQGGPFTPDRLQGICKH